MEAGRDSFGAFCTGFKTIMFSAVFSPSAAWCSSRSKFVARNVPRPFVGAHFHFAGPSLRGDVCGP